MEEDLNKQSDEGKKKERPKKFLTPALDGPMRDDIASKSKQSTETNLKDQ